MTSDFSSARLGIAVRINLKSFIAENALPAQTSLFGSAFWLKPGISEVNCRIQNLRLDWWLWSSIAPLQFPPSPSLTVCGRRISLFQDSASV